MNLLKIKSFSSFHKFRIEEILIFLSIINIDFNVYIIGIWVSISLSLIIRAYRWWWRTRCISCVRSHSTRSQLFARTSTSFATFLHSQSLTSTPSRTTSFSLNTSSASISSSANSSVALCNWIRDTNFFVIIFCARFH